MKQPTLLLSTTKTITTLLLWLVFYIAHGQAPSKNLLQYIPQRFIDKIELVVGPSFNIPNDHGWAEYFKNLPGDKSTDEVKNKIGYFVGLGFTHTMSKRFELTGWYFMTEKATNKKVQVSIVKQKVITDMII